jgi:superfamily II DNA or RNA helicase
MLDLIRSLPDGPRRMLEILATTEDVGATLTQLRAVLDDPEVRPGAEPLAPEVIDRMAQGLVATRFAQREGRLYCAPSVREILLRELRRTRRYALLSDRTAEPAPQGLAHTGSAGSRIGQAVLLRELRRSLYADDAERAERLLEGAPAEQAVAMLVEPLDEELLQGMSAPLAGRLLELVSRTRFSQGLGTPGLLGLARVLAQRHGTPQLQDVAAREALLAGVPDTDAASPGTAALLALARGELAPAVQGFAAALATERTRTKKRKVLLPEPEGPLVPLAWLVEGSETRGKQALALIELAEAQRGGSWASVAHLRRLVEPRHKTTSASSHPLGVLLEALVACWSGGELEGRRLAAAQSDAEAAGWVWLARELALLGESGLQPLPGTAALRDLRRAVTDWQHRLQALLELVEAPPKTQERLAWFVRFAPFEIEARLQARGKDGSWSAGRKVAHARLKAGGTFPMTEADHRVAAALAVEGSTRYGEIVYRWRREDAWQALVDHPAVFGWSGQPLVVVSLRPRLQIETEGDEAVVRVVPAPGQSSVVAEPVGEGGVEVTVFDEVQRKAAQLVGEGLRLPLRARPGLPELLERFAGRFEVRGGADAGGAAVTEADPAPAVQLVRTAGGATARVVVRPLGPDGPAWAPLAGPRVVLGRVGEQAVRAERDFAAERQGLRALEQRAPELTGSGPAALTAQELLDLLERLRGERVEWVEGKPLSLRAPRGWSLSARRAASGWLSAQGALQLEGGQEISLPDLVERARQTTGRFLQLDEDTFVALSAELRTQLGALGRTARREGEVLQVHPLAAGLLEPMLDPLEAGTPAEPPPVSTLLATELRPYQEEARSWALRLAALGLGACLADDMGLGKTVTALAVLLQRAADGPALVVAPTSVCGVWREAAWRFAPALQVVELARERDVLEHELAPGSLALCSYGLLVSEAPRLAALPWSTVILDEAQAIKNPETQRHRAALSLRARFKMTLTGTPIENHLVELWAQSAFLAPGLLGTQQEFVERFVRPIEQGSVEVQQQLRRLVAPLVLRRTKAQVLGELPPRTDVDWQVELPPEHAAVYEAVRRQAVGAIRAAQADPMQLLAELTRLRQAACHPRLVSPEAPDISGKLEAFLELVDSLQASGHRALVFSQFVRHLQLVRERLDERGLSYQYLDGQTEASERDARVAAFQRGEGALFLISLRAGGFGLTLTAAEAVVHLDPWWNPAVEDQASDRAHRIGQTRPVTVYRLVAKGTIEERILALHRTKRDLADRVLAGTDKAARLTTEELAALILDGDS